MLNCCVSLEEIKSEGISLQKLAELARCNGAACTIKNSEDFSLVNFRRIVRHIMQGEHGKAYLVANYDRKTIGQTGGGHFSPIGSYNNDKDMVLVMDTARFKYPPHWVPLSLIYEAMRTAVDASGQRRGFLVFYRQERKGLVFTVCRPALKEWIQVNF
mmetsp:Transcript_4272/g.6501  ORF Transcript_4272/g.6501 Transcript_4272/m.6501 type:complete len:158 (+) Transcript_4272:367-840(+)